MTTSSPTTSKNTPTTRTPASSPRNDAAGGARDLTANAAKTGTPA